MSDWNFFYRKVVDHIRNLETKGCDLPYFRGHADADWNLAPGLARSSRSLKAVEDTEARIYYEFISLGGPLTAIRHSNWEVLFSMQHHGLPTRLLDWTSSFATALYFALHSKVGKPGPGCVWVLDPYRLNKICLSEEVILTPPDDFEGDYYENFITHAKTLGHRAVAINPTRLNARQIAQDSTFTLFGDILNPLEEIAPTALRKFVIPDTAIMGAIEFVQMAGISEHKLFPDLDGIARYIRDRHWVDV